MHFKFFLFIPFAFFLASCGSISPLSKDKGTDVQNSFIAASFYQHEKKISYTELLYKVLWNESRNMEASYQGIWDIDKDLSQYFSNQLNDNSFSSESIHSLLSEENLQAFHKMYSDSDEPGQLIRKEGHVIRLDDEIRSNLSSQGIKYILTLFSDYTYAYTQMGLKQIHPRSQLSVIDIAKNEEIYFGPMTFIGKPTVEKSIREIEDNNLAEYKRVMKAGIDVILEKPFPKALGIYVKE